MTVTSLYICISYIYTYPYNFYDLSYLHAYCMSISFGTCSMFLAYLLSILLLYSCFYTLHIPILFILSNAFHVVQNLCIYHIIPYLSRIFFLFLVICLYRILDLFHIISCIILFARFLYFHVHFLSCSYTVHVSYTFISQILSYNLSYIVLYFYLHSYTFHIRYFCMLSYDTFHVLYFHMSFTYSSFFIFHFYVLFHIVATRPCCTFHSSFSYLYYHILSCYMLLSCTFHMLSSCTIHILHIHLYVLILLYSLCFRKLSVLFLYWFKTNTFISYLYFSYYVNLYLIFPISRRSIRLILLLSYHILSYVFIYVFMCFHILYFSYTFLFSLLSALYLFISFSCTTLCTFYILY